MYGPIVNVPEDEDDASPEADRERSRVRTFGVMGVWAKIFVSGVSVDESGLRDVSEDKDAEWMLDARSKPRPQIPSRSSRSAD